jgi:carbamoyl-phosphate synthase large subunit
VFAAKECGYETIMINCNPETVSTDFDTLINCILNQFSGHIYDIIQHENQKALSFN